MRQTFTALKYPNYRLWFSGQIVSLVGTWTQMTAQGYLVFELTHSTAYLGYVGFANGVSAWLLMPWAGVVADRVSRRQLLLGAQSLMMLLALLLGTLTFLGRIEPWHIVGLAFLMGAANAFDAPTRNAFILEMVEREDMANAIALNSTTFQIASAVGPALAGLLYAGFGPAWCFLLNGASYVFVILALLRMRLAPRTHVAATQPALHALRDGLRYAAQHRRIRALLLVASACTLFGLTYVTLLPAWAVVVLGGDARTNGWLQSARGAGALLAALMIASLGRFQRKGWLLSVGSLVFPAMLLAFTAMRWLPGALVAILAVGWGQMLLFNMVNTLIQTLVADEYRGRVMSFYTLTFFGLMPLTALWSGTAAEHLGLPLTMAAGAAVCLVGAALLWRYRPGLRALP